MAKESRPSTPLNPDPLVEQLVDNQTGLPNSLILRGYIGPSTSEERLTVFPTLDDLSQSFELSRADVLAVNDAPESQLPKGGKVIWVKNDAAIIQRNTKTAQQYTQIRRGRLHITMTRRLGVQDVCMTFNCQVCTSNCGINCVSECHPRLRVRKAIK